MKLLITNDDGIYAEGIAELAKIFVSGGHDVVISAPAQQMSGASHSVSIQSPLKVDTVELKGLGGIRAYSVTGTPADCVKLAVANLGVSPDIVVSGINMGANLGTDVFYSGTVAAAMEAVITGIPAIAVSICNHEPKHLATAAFCAEKALEIMNTETGWLCRLLSVNVPDIPINELQGMRFARLCKRQYSEVYQSVGSNSYMIASWDFNSEEPSADTDERCIRERYAAMTPIITDMCDHGLLAEFKGKYGWSV